MKIFGFRRMSLFFLLLGIVVAGPTLATEPVPITADAAFDAVATQTDPESGEPASVALVDVRTRAEYFWVGAPAQVDAIVLKDESDNETELDDEYDDQDKDDDEDDFEEHLVIEPDLGKVKLIGNGRFLKFRLNDRKKLVPVKKVDEIRLTPIATSIPFKLWDEQTATLVGNPNFAEDIENLAMDFQVVILYCLSGGRSTACAVQLEPDLFEAVYEIDDSEGGGRGGFEGSAYNKVYNGYLGFPGRPTRLQDVPSVSWKDSGLPMKTRVNPLQ